MAVCAVTQQVVPLLTITKELGDPALGPIQVLCDNTGAVALSRDPVHPKRTKHIDVKFHYIREKVADGTRPSRWPISQRRR